MVGTSDIIPKSVAFSGLGTVCLPQITEMQTTAEKTSGCTQSYVAELNQDTVSNVT